MAFLFSSVNAFAQLTVKDILAKADSVTRYQDTLLAHTKYKYKEFVIMNELKKDGSIDKADTFNTLVTMDGKIETSRETIYSTKGGDKKKEEKSSGKEEKSIGIEFSLNSDNPDYNFSLTETNDSSYIIAVSPKSDPPKEGQVKGDMTVDRQSFFISKMSFVVPRPEGALKEFSVEMDFEPLEGGLVVMTATRAKGFAKAFLGIFKMRFSMSTQLSDFEVLK